MNFSFLNAFPDLDVFRRYCLEAEDFVHNYPDVSITAARKAAEFMVKLLYGSSISSAIYGMTVYDMLSDPQFTAWVGSDALLRRLHFIRRIGNQAVHQGGLTQDDAMKTLEQLHALAGDLCMKLGLIRSYPPFDPNLTEAAEDEPTVDQALIARFAGRLHRVFAPSQQRGHIDIVEQFMSTKELSAHKRLNPTEKATNTAANSRAAFQILAEYFATSMGEQNVLADYHELLLHVTTGSKRSVLAVRTACCRIAVKSAQGEWLYMPGVDYVLYTDKLDAGKPVLEQFSVFTVQEFITLWQDLKHIHPVVSSGASKRLKQVLGTDVKITIDEYADELRIQTLGTAHRKKKQKIAETLAAMPKLEDGGMEKMFI